MVECTGCAIGSALAILANEYLIDVEHLIAGEATDLFTFPFSLGGKREVSGVMYMLVAVGSKSGCGCGSRLRGWCWTDV